MTLPIIIYLINLTDGIATMFCILFFASVGFLLWQIGKLALIQVSGGPVFDSERKTVETAPIKLKTYWYWPLVFGLVCCAIPDKKTSYTILAAYGVQSAANTPRVQAIAENSMKLIEQTISEYLKPEKESK